MTALAGLKVIDLTHIMAGPTCTLMLADMGADVIKVEKVPGGDDTRRSVPPSIGEESAAFLMMNRSKRGIAIDLRQDILDPPVNFLLPVACDLRPDPSMPLEQDAIYVGGGNTASGNGEPLQCVGVVCTPGSAPPPNGADLTAPDTVIMSGPASGATSRNAVPGSISLSMRSRTNSLPCSRCRC